MAERTSASRKHDELFADAEGYESEKVPKMFEPAARFFLKHVVVKPMDRVLDVACGTGIVARLVARQPGFNGSVTGLDIDPNMLAVARSVTSSEDHRIFWREGDALNLPIDADSFDLVLCQQGIQYFPSKEEALRSMYRVLVPGGRVAILVAASITPEGQPRKWAELEALRRHVGSEAAEKERHPGYFKGGSEPLETLVSGAGFRDVDVRLRLDYWGPMGTLEELIPEEKYSYLEGKARTAVVEDIRHAMKSFDKGSETQLPAGFYIASGTK